MKASIQKKRGEERREELTIASFCFSFLIILYRNQHKNKEYYSGYLSIVIEEIIGSPARFTHDYSFIFIWLLLSYQ